MTRCKGKTNVGLRCKKSCPTGQDFCYIHRRSKAKQKGDCYLLLLINDEPYNEGAYIWERDTIAKLLDIVEEHSWIREGPNSINLVKYGKPLVRLPPFCGIDEDTDLSGLRKEAKQYPKLTCSNHPNRESHFCGMCDTVHLVKKGVTKCPDCERDWVDTK